MAAPGQRRRGSCRLTQRAQFARDGFVVVPDIATAGELVATRRRSRRVGAPRPTLAAQADSNGRANIAEAGAITFTVQCVTRSRRGARVREAPDASRAVQRTARARREPLLGSGRLQEAREATTVPVAPGHRLHVHRAPALPDVLGVAERRDGRQRLPVGAARRRTATARCCTGGSTRSVGSASTHRRGGVAAEVPAGGAVVFSSLTPHQTGPNLTPARARPTSCSTDPDGMQRVPGRLADPARSRPGPRPATTPTGSSPCCATALPV